MDSRPSESVQIYLTQMSNTPLLSRQEELAAARRVENARRDLRRAMLGADYVMQAAVAVLYKVAQGRIRIEVACEGPHSLDEQKQRLMAAVGPNVHTLQHLIARNGADFAAAISRGRSPDRRQQVAGDCNCDAPRRFD